MDEKDKLLVEMLIAQRNEHLNRFYEVNGRFSLGLLTFSATVIFSAASGAEKISKLLKAGLLSTCFFLLE